MKTFLATLMLTLATPALSQVVVAPPTATDMSPEARAARMFPWASQSKQRDIATELFRQADSVTTHCASTQDGAVIHTVCKIETRRNP